MIGEEVIAVYGDAGDGEELFEVQKLVRCRDCKYWVSDGGAMMICDIHKDPTVSEHFCSYGERNSSEKPNNSERSSE